MAVPRELLVDARGTLLVAPAVRPNSAARPVQYGWTAEDEELLGDDERRSLRPQLPPLPVFRGDVVNAYEQSWLESYNAGAYCRDVWVCLCKAKTSRTSWWRSFVRERTRAIAGEYVHVELLFRTSRGSFAWTVDLPDETKPGSGYVRLTTIDELNAYPTEFWDTRQIATATGGERVALFDYCRRQEGKPMNDWGLYQNFLPILSWDCFVGTPRLEEDRYFCSQLVASALRWIRPDHFAHVNTRKCTPNELYAILEANQDMFLGSSIRPYNETPPSRLSSTAAAAAAASPV